MKKYNVAVVGATGMVGREMVEVLEERDFPVDKIKLLASYRSKGKEISFHKKKIIVEELKEDSFNGVDIALFSAGGNISKKFAPVAVDAGSIVVDNSSAFRMDDDVPLVVPEINPVDIEEHKGIIANPNCSTIQLAVVLNIANKMAEVKRVIVSTYQSVSGWGKRAVEQLWGEVKELYDDYNKNPNCYKVKNYDSDKPIPYQIAFNAVPHIDRFLEGGYTKEEWKMVNETKKILDDDNIDLTATCVRIPVIRAHSEAVNLETKQELDIGKFKKMLDNSDGVHVVDNPEKFYYPMPADAAAKDGIFVGRIRKDDTIENGINLWIVSDNLRKGAALNAVQIAEEIINK